MKKFFALLLALSLMLLCAGAMAEPTKLNENYDALDFYLDAPEGAVLTQEVFDPGMMGMVLADDLPDLIVMFALAPDDSYTEVDMSELTTAEIADLSGMVEEDLGSAVSETYDMPCGLKAMTLTSSDGTEAIFMTLKDGYFFYLEGMHIGTEEDAEAQVLTEKELTFIKTVFDSLSYTENAQ